MRTRWKAYLPPAWISPLKRALAIVKLVTLWAATRWRVLCSLYYGVISSAFRREHQAVAKGLIRYHSRRDKSARLHLLRRNVHRLEKALLMRPRKELFALDYIGETVACFGECYRSSSEAEKETVLQWAADVIGSYFDSVGDHEIVARSRSRFESAVVNQENSGRIPYRRILDDQPVEYEELLALARRRRSVRWFLDAVPPRQLVDKALIIANLAPSACNRQPFQFRIYDDPATVGEIARIPLGTRGFRENIPMISVVVGDLSAYFSERDRHGIYVDASMAIMGFMYGLETLGLSSCPLNWPDIPLLERRMSDLLSLEAHERIIMLIAIGHPDPDGMVAYSQKKHLSDIRSYND